MLCYRSSRNASDVIHDSFYWLSNNVRALKLISLPILAVCTLIIYFFGCDTGELYSYRSNYLSFVFYQLVWPFSDSEEAAGALSLLTLFTTLFLVPLLVRYFIGRRSLQAINAEGWITAYNQCKAKTLLSSATMALAIYLSVTYHLLTMLLVMTAATIITPCIIMGNVGHLITSKKAMALKSLVLSLLLLCIITSLPLFTIDVFDLLMFIIDNSMLMPSSLVSADNGTVDFVVTLLLYASFCYAIIVSEVMALMLHGSIFTEKDS